MKEHQIRSLLNEIADSATSLALYSEHGLSTDNTSEDELECDLDRSINDAVKIIKTAISQQARTE